MGQDTSQIREEIEITRAEMGDTVDALAHKADVKTRMKESFADKRDRFKAQIQGTTHKVGEATPDGQQMKEGAQQAVGVAEENPIGLALGGVAAGFLVGMMLPSSRIEDERMGPIADQVKDTAREAGQEALEHGQEVAGEVAEHAAEGAKEIDQDAMETAKSGMPSSSDAAPQTDETASPERKSSPGTPSPGTPSPTTTRTF